MCDFSKGFILCKCDSQKRIVHNKKSRRNKTEPKIEYSWSLHRLLGPSPFNEIGRYKLPSSNVGNGLTADFVKEELNARNCFDFQYKPVEGDNLKIENKELGTRLEFILKNNYWIEDDYSPFDFEIERFNFGRVLDDSNFI